MVRGPLEVGAQEPVDGPHEFNLEFCRKQAFEAFLDGGVFGEVDKIVHVEPEMERLVVCCCWRTGRRGNALEETGVVKNWLEDHVDKDGVDHLVSVSQ